jgi:hypothetical protein
MKTASAENRERILKAVRETKQIAYKSIPIQITAGSSTETLKAKRAWNKVFQALKVNNFSLGQSTQKNYHSKLMEE